MHPVITGHVETNPLTRIVFKELNSYKFFNLKSQIGFLDVWVIQQIGASPLQGYPSGLQDIGHMGELEGMTDILFHQEDRDTFGIDRLDNFEDAFHNQGCQP